MSYFEINDELLLSYVDGALDPSQRAEVDTLLDTTPELRAEVEALRRMQRRLGATLKTVDLLPGPGPGVWTTIYRRIKRSPRITPTFRRGLATSFQLALSVAVVAVFALLVGSARNRPENGDRTGALAPSSTAVVEAPAAEWESDGTLSQFFSAYNRGSVDDVLPLLEQTDYRVCSQPGVEAAHIVDRAALERWLVGRFAAREQFRPQSFQLNQPRGARTADQRMQTDAVVLRTIEAAPATQQLIAFVLSPDGQRIHGVEIGCRDVPADHAGIQPAQTVVVNHFLEAYNRGDLDGALVTLARIDVELVQCAPDRVVQGFQDREALSAWLRERFAEHDQLQSPKVEETRPGAGSPGVITVRVTAHRSNDRGTAGEIVLSFRLTPDAERIDKATFYCNQPA